MKVKFWLVFLGALALIAGAAWLIEEGLLSQVLPNNFDGVVWLVCLALGTLVGAEAFQAILRVIRREDRRNEQKRGGE